MFLDMINEAPQIKHKQLWIFGGVILVAILGMLLYFLVHKARQKANNK